MFYFLLLLGIAMGILPDDQTPRLSGFVPSHWMFQQRGNSVAKKTNSSHSSVAVVSSSTPIKRIGVDKYLDHGHGHPNHLPPWWPDPPPPPPVINKPKPPDPESQAVIKPTPSTISLVCQVGAPFEHISWWLYPCPRGGGYPERTPIASGASTIDKNGYDVTIVGKADRYTSSLEIKDVTASHVAGMYECESFSLISPRSAHGDHGSAVTNDYFLIGKSQELYNCFTGYGHAGRNIETSGDDGTIDNSFRRYLSLIVNETVRREPREEHEYLLKIPYNKTATQDYKIRFTKASFKNRQLNNSSSDFTVTKPEMIDRIKAGPEKQKPEKDVKNESTEVNLENSTTSAQTNRPLKAQKKNDTEEVKTELELPAAQNGGVLPIQNSSYIRFDFTNGEKIQNWN